MKELKAVLELCRKDAGGVAGSRWGFRFNSPTGEVLMESAATYDSRDEAEAAFVAILKQIAVNDYEVRGPAQSSESAEIKEPCREQNSFWQWPAPGSTGCPRRLPTQRR